MPRFGDVAPPKKSYPPKRNRARGPRNNFPDGTLPSLFGVCGVYLIHFDRPLGHARHYMGCAQDIDKRIGRHERGTGAKIMKAVKKAGISWEVVHVWPCASRHEAEERERRLKGYNTKQCPMCTPWEEVAGG